MKKLIAMLLALMMIAAVLASCEIVSWDSLREDTTTTTTTAAPEETTTKKPWTPVKPGENKPQEEETTTVAPSEELEFPQLPI